MTDDYMMYTLEAFLPGSDMLSDLQSDLYSRQFTISELESRLGEPYRNDSYSHRKVCVDLTELIKEGYVLIYYECQGEIFFSITDSGVYEIYKLYAKIGGEKDEKSD